MGSEILSQSGLSLLSWRIMLFRLFLRGNNVTEGSMAQIYIIWYIKQNDIDGSSACRVVQLVILYMLSSGRL